MITQILYSNSEEQNFLSSKYLASQHVKFIEFTLNSDFSFSFNDDDIAGLNILSHTLNGIYKSYEKDFLFFEPQLQLRLDEKKFYLTVYMLEKKYCKKD